MNLEVKKVILENCDNGTTTKKNPNSASVIYLTTKKVDKCSMVSENRKINEEGKMKHQIIQPPEMFVFKNIYLNIFLNFKTPCTAYCRLLDNNLF